MKQFAFVLALLFVGTAFATGDKITTSKNYVDTQIATKQDKIPAINSDTVVTHTNTSGEIGEKAIYDTTESYAAQTDALVTAGVANAAIQNAIDTEFVCIEWAPNTEQIPENCYIWSIRAAQSASLPNGYTQLEYLESSGTQWIDTEIVPTDMTGLKVKFNRYVSGDQVVVGVSYTNSGTFYVNPAARLLLPFGTGWLGTNCGTTINNTDYEVMMNYMNNRKRYVNGVDKMDITTTLGPSRTMYMFAGRNSDHAEWFFKGRIYYLQITNNSSFVRDMIPVRRDSDGELGMYDLVSRTFFTNSGTGAFVAGPVASYLPQGQ